MWWILGLGALVTAYWLSPSAREDRRKAEQERAERQRDVEAHRDADQQERPYSYKVLRHGNETLAVRYGIANRKRVVDEYWYRGKGGAPRRNPDRDRTRHEDADTINLRKLGRVEDGVYEVELVDFGGRKARARIHPGREYVNAFLPPDGAWSDDFAALEQTLKGGGAFTLKELAKFHVEMAIARARK